MSDESLKRRRFMQIGFVILGITSMVALIAIIATAIEKVNNGHGLDIYHTAWLVEFNWVAFLVLMLAIVVALLGAAWFRYLEWREVEQMREKYQNKGYDV